MLVHAFVSILGLYPVPVPGMGHCPVAPAPFGSCLIYLFMLFIYVEHPIKLFKKKGMKQSATAINSHRFNYDCDHITRSAILVLPQTQKFAGGKMSGCER